MSHFNLSTGNIGLSDLSLIVRLFVAVVQQDVIAHECAPRFAVRIFHKYLGGDSGPYVIHGFTYPVSWMMVSRMSSVMACSCHILNTVLT